VKLVNKYKEWLKLTQTDKEKINMEIPDIDRNKNFIEQLLRADFDLSKVKFPTISDSKLKYIIESNSAREGYMEVSDDPFQNTLYRLAKELF
jgi:ATP-dependent Lon protease